MTKYALNYMQDGYFCDGDWMTDFIRRFAGRYSAAIDSWMAGNTRDITKPWKDAFTYSNGSKSTVTQDLFLGMNVHINYDLAIIVYQMNQGIARKPDYDRVNDLLMDVVAHVQTEMGERYDPSFLPGGANSNFLLQDVITELLLGWRDVAWTNGQQLILTGGSILSYGVLQTAVDVNALPYRQPTSAADHDAKVQYCEDHHHTFSFV